eukprot:1207492-Rhodomonas_salina.1
MPAAGVSSRGTDVTSVAVCRVDGGRAMALGLGSGMRRLRTKMTPSSLSSASSSPSSWSTSCATPHPHPHPTHQKQLDPETLQSSVLALTTIVECWWD